MAAPVGVTCSWPSGQPLQPVHHMQQQQQQSNHVWYPGVVQSGARYGAYIVYAGQKIQVAQCGGIGTAVRYSTAAGSRRAGSTKQPRERTSHKRRTQAADVSARQGWGQWPNTSSAAAVTAVEAL
jgi:hypothetical protein